MNTRYLLITCLSLIAGSIFLAPETVQIGASPAIASSLSHMLLLAGMGAAALTVDAEARERARQEGQGKEK